MSKTKSTQGDDDVSEEKENDAMAAIKRLPTDRLQQLVDAAKAELKTRDNSEERASEEARVAKMSDQEFRLYVSDLVDSKSKSKSEE
jgi:hypothetical protein